MRAVWWSIAALALLAVASALRTSQVDGATRTGRRLPAPSDTEVNSPAEASASDVKPTFRPRATRRREGTTPQPTRDAVRTRTRSRPTAAPDTSSVQPQISTGRNDRLNPRRLPNRTPSRAVQTETAALNKDNAIRTRSRSNIRRPSSTLPPVEVSSPTIDEGKLEVISSTLDDLAKVTPTTEKLNDANSQFRRRSSTIPTTERVGPPKKRGRINPRANARSLDLEISGTTNTLTNAEKEPITARIEDLRNSRKLRYKTQLSETDTNLTDEGLKTQREVIISSQNENNVTSQPKTLSSAPEVSDNSVQFSTEGTTAKPSTLTINKTIRRPLSRGKVGFKPKHYEPLPKNNKKSDEISEDDNYPASFKALIQAKSASTQTNSSPSESLSVKASQKIYTTYTASSQSTNTGTTINKYARLRNKMNAENKEGDEEKIDTNLEKSTESSSVETSTLKAPESKQRATFVPRRKFSPSSTTAPSSSRRSEKIPYKYNRKFKPTTESSQQNITIKPRRAEGNGAPKKAFTRSSYYQRKNFNTTNITSDNQKNLTNKTENSPVVKNVLPRTSYYSRSRNNKNSPSTSTTSTESSKDSGKVIGQTKKDDMPFIFTLLNNPVNMDTSSEKMQNLETEPNQDDKEMFIIAVTSKESQERNSLNEVTNAVEENENSPVFNAIPTTVKYHANYKDVGSTIAPNSAENVISSTVPPVRNLRTRKYGRKYSKPDQTEDPEPVSKQREKSFRKVGESFSKTTEASTNGINSETEKTKGRFSSKYRAPSVDRPIYKATVPTITSSTAWLKFFVTDQLLTKSLEEPIWFEDYDLDDVKTESMSRQTTVSPFIHESSLELVEGEEIDLGSGINAISFTKTRSTLSSADLRLSENLMKSTHTMNVEASHHSPSVTVSIFDALAEILTSTPRIRLSTTTEVTQKSNINNDAIQTFNGVSNINVNSVGSSPSQDTFMTTTADVNTNAKTVQITEQTTPIVINNLSVGDGATSSLNTEMEKNDLVNTLNPIPTPSIIPTTPISARRPFAIKVLYSDTESTVDSLSTISPYIQPSTDSTTVHNTVSDLLLLNNPVVSSELTSMLTNNIKNIIQNMDESSKSRITLDMAKMLKTLIPKAVDGLVTLGNDVDLVPSTTPYSLEDIIDTENIDISSRFGDEISNINILQSVPTNNVNSTVNSTLSDDVFQVVNSSNTTQSTLSVSSSSTTPVALTFATAPLSAKETTTQSVPEAESVSSFTDSLRKDIAIENIETTDRTESSNSPSINTSVNNIRFPFLTNYRAEDFNVPEKNNSENNNTQELIKSLPLRTLPNNPASVIDNINTDDPSQVSKFQLWVLSRKASILKMIEDLIRQHNVELATAQPLTDMISNTNNELLSDRLTKIMTNMGTTTDITKSNNFDSTSSTTISHNFIPMSTSTQIITSASEIDANDNDLELVKAETTTSSFELVTNFDNLSLRFNEDEITQNITTATRNESLEGSASTGNNVTSDISDNNQENIMSTTIATDINSETTTFQISAETTTDTTDSTINENENTESTVVSSSTTKIADIVKIETNQNGSSADSLVSSSEPSTPKKDFVIFGILPNNTVVRKNPNDDVLETLTEASPYIVYGVLPNNTIIRKFPNGTRVPRIMQKIDVLPISPWSLRNPYSPIHNNPAIVRPQSNPNRVSTNIVTSTDSSNNGTESRLTTDTVNNLQMMIPSSALNIKDSSLLGITTATNKSPAEKSTASHVLSLRTTTMLPSVDEILLNSISSAAKEEMVISTMTSSTSEPRILTLDIDPETQQIRTEKPSDGDGSAIFKFIPIDEVTVAPQKTNVLKLASTKVPSNTEKNDIQSTTSKIVTEINTQTPEILSRFKDSDETSSTTVNPATDTVTVPITTISEFASTTEVPTVATTTIGITSALPLTTTLAATTTTTTSAPTTSIATTTTEAPTTTTKIFAPTTTTTEFVPTTKITTPATTTVDTSTVQTTIAEPSTVTSVFTTEEERQYQQDTKLLHQILQENFERNSIISNLSPTTQDTITTTVQPTTKVATSTTIDSNEAKLLQALLGTTVQSSTTLNVPNVNAKFIDTNNDKSTTRSFEDDIRQFEDDTKLLKALLQATGQNPDNFNIPTLNFKATTPISTQTTTANPTTITTTTTTSTTPKPRPTTTILPKTTTQTINDDIKQLQEDTKLLQALLQATQVQNTDNTNAPIISGVTSNVRIASNPRTTSLGSSPTTTANVRPVYTKTTLSPPVFTFAPKNTIQTSTAEDIGISTTFLPFDQERRLSTTTERINDLTTYLTGRRAPNLGFTSTTEMPSTSTFSVAEDLAFLKNLKTVLKTNPNNEDPEAALANRIIALAVERSLNEIQSNQVTSDRSGKAISNNAINVIPTTTTPSTTTRATTTTTRATTTTRRTTTTTTPRPTTTTPRPTTIPTITTTANLNTPSLEDDIKQFQEDTKLLQALLKATGQDPSQFNIPTLPPLNTNTKVSPIFTTDLKLLTNNNLVQRNTRYYSTITNTANPLATIVRKTTARPFGAKIAVKGLLKTNQDDEKLLKTLIKLQDAQETTTHRNKLAITGQTSDEALKKLLLNQQKTKASSMMSQATQAPMSLSTEYGKSNDALLAALLKEQGFGPTTASSLDEQLRLSALLNQVVVTPKARATLPPPTTPSPRRPILDGLAWLWQQWRETAPAPNSRPSRPSPSPSASVASAATSQRLSWFGSGPFVGNADDQPSSNRVPLEPPRAVTSQQTPGRGQLVSAAINVTRAFSQFLGAAIQGAAQTVQSVIRAGQRAATDVYSNGSGTSG